MENALKLVYAPVGVKDLSATNVLKVGPSNLGACILVLDEHGSIRLPDCFSLEILAGDLLQYSFEKIGASQPAIKSLEKEILNQSLFFSIISEGDIIANLLPLHESEIIGFDIRDLSNNPIGPNQEQMRSLKALNDLIENLSILNAAKFLANGNEPTFSSLSTIGIWSVILNIRNKITEDLDESE